MTTTLNRVYVLDFSTQIHVAVKRHHLYYNWGLEIYAKVFWFGYSGEKLNFVLFIIMFVIITMVLTFFTNHMVYK